MPFIGEMIEKGKYRDHQGKPYRVLGSARNSITFAPVIVLEALFKNGASRYWVVPLEKFMEKILVGGKKIQRFSKVDSKKPGTESSRASRPKKDKR